jgi:hypothetical protein
MDDPDAPVSHRKTVLFVNHFVVEVTRFLNRFANVCEERLLQVGSGVDRLETALAVLEARLGSVDGVALGTPAQRWVVDYVAAAAAVVVVVLFVYLFLVSPVFFLFLFLFFFVLFCFFRSRPDSSNTNFLTCIGTSTAISRPRVVRRRPRRRLRRVRHLRRARLLRRPRERRRPPQRPRLRLTRARSCAMIQTMPASSR